MSKVTYKSLYTLVNEQINNRLTFNSKTPQNQQLDRSIASPQSTNSPGAGGSDVSSQKLISALNIILQTALPQRIISGLSVKATNPISNTIIINAGTGTVGGTVYTLDSGVALPIPFDSVNHVFYVNLKNDNIKIDTSGFDDRLTIAKIVVPNPGVTLTAQDKNDGSDIAYINQYQTFTLHADETGQLEEDSLEFFRNNIGQILADNLIGNIELSENLKIINTTGTLMLDSSSVNIYDVNNNQLAKFNQNGIFFYNSSGIELAKFATDEARLGNILIKTNAIQSGNFSTGFQGFQIRDDGNAEFNNLVVRGTVYATAGVIGGFTILPTRMYGGSIATASTVGSGSTGVIMDASGLRGYDAVLGQTFNLPTNGSAPTFSSGIINSTIFNINTNAVMRTSTTVGDGSSSSAGVLINNTGLYACGSNQLLSNANLKALIDGTVSLSGTITASAGQIGGVTITSTSLSGGLIIGARITSAIIETATATPKIRIDTTGIVYQATSSVGTYGAVSSGGSGFRYGSGTLYGSGLTGSVFNSSYPMFSVLAQGNLADFRMYNRGALPSSGSYSAAVGDMICVNGVPRFCTGAGAPGTYSSILISAGTTQGSASAGVGKQSVTVNIAGTNYKLLYDT